MLSAPNESGYKLLKKPSEQVNIISQSAPLASRALIEYGRKQPRKDLKQLNIPSPSDSYFIIDTFIKFTNEDSNVQLPQYTVFRQKIVTPAEILNNALVFNSHFENEIKDLYLDKAFEKHCIFIKTYDNNVKLYLQDITQAYI